MHRSLPILPSLPIRRDDHSRGRATSYHRSVISPELLEVLACPKCKQKIRLDDAGPALVCDACRLRYPIVDGIPVMLIDEAESF